jgi:hypothetical protein
MRFQESSGNVHIFGAGISPITRVLIRRANRVRLHLFYEGGNAADELVVILSAGQPTDDGHYTFVLSNSLPYYEDIQPDCWDGEIWVVSSAAGAAFLRSTERWRP